MTPLEGRPQSGPFLFRKVVDGCEIESGNLAYLNLLSALQRPHHRRATIQGTSMAPTRSSWRSPPATIRAPGWR